MIASTAWAVTWVLGVAGIAKVHGDGDIAKVNGAVLALLLVSLLWGCITASNVI